MDVSETRIVFCNAPDIDTAEKIAHRLIDSRLAACVNVSFPCRSFYRWDDQVIHDEEIPMVIKTTEARYSAVQSLICELHPYDVPEILAIPVTEGLPDYCHWVRESVNPSTVI